MLNLMGGVEVNKRQLVHQIYSMSQMFSRTAEIESQSVMPKSEFKILYHIRKNQKESDTLLTSREIADLMNVSSPAISRTVKGLVAKNWIVQQDNPEDRRNIFLKLTDEGLKNYNRATQRMENSLKLIFEEFTEEELKEFIDTGNRLTKVINRIKKESEE